MCSRIIKSHSKASLSPETMSKSYQKVQQYKNLRSRYSNKNKSLLEEMVDGLHVKKRYAQFLPQIMKPKESKVENSLYKRHNSQIVR